MTDHTASPFSLKVTGHEAHQIRAALTSAVDQTVSDALQAGRQGGLITQHS
ncbi:hypothetical protein [Paenarthrobacter sp. NPDC057981]|uniref:hypothetical protein n=1 Tax=Paenarthrobacter sp. NPDC057981 TaxID=3346297 RepID=UPI0036DDC357